MRKRLYDALARLASEKYVARYVLHGSPTEYALPEELLDDACSEAQALLRAAGSEGLGGSAREGLETFLADVRGLEPRLQLDDAQVTNAMLIGSASWGQLRAAAASCLATLSLDLAEWETANGL